MAAFCGRCGAPAARPEIAFCTRCGAHLADAAAGPSGSDPYSDEQVGERDTDPGTRPSAGAGPSTRRLPAGGARPGGRYAAATTTPAASNTAVQGWEMVALGALALTWAACAIWWTAPVAVDLARGVTAGPLRLVQAVAVVAIPPLAVVAFFSMRLAGRGGWRWAVPMLAVVPILLIAIPEEPRPSATVAAETPGAATPDAAKPAAAAPAATPSPAPTAVQGQPGGLPIPVPKLPLPGLDKATPGGGLPVPGGLPIPGVGGSGGDPTPVPNAKLTRDEAKDRVKDFIEGCRRLGLEMNLAQVAFEAGNWLVRAPGGGIWIVNDATGAITADAQAEERQKDCREQ